MAWIFMAQMGSKWRTVVGTIINYKFNSNELHLLSSIYSYVNTILFYVLLSPACFGCDVS
jgi:hypothetical protein